MTIIAGIFRSHTAVFHFVLGAVQDPALFCHGHEVLFLLS
jgi:hypothetical protein